MTVTIESIRAEFAEMRQKTAALPDTGHVLFCAETALAITIPGGNAEAGRITGLIFAHIFSDADRANRAGTPGLDRLYSDGADHKFLLIDIQTAKMIALRRIDIAIASIGGIEG